MNEKPRRLQPRLQTLRELFLKSGNLCAFPNCTELMMNRDGEFIGQICHIEAAEKGGERFNPRMTNEQRRAASNLIIMCYTHHRITNNVDDYPVDRLRRIKHEHEQRFSHPDRAILDHLVDWTTTDRPTEPRNLRRMNEALKWELTEADLESAVTELNKFIQTLSLVPIDVRVFVSAVAKRMHRVQGTRSVRDELFGTNLLLSDFQSSYRISDSAIRKNLTQMDAYGIGGMDEIDMDFGPEPAIRLRTLKSGWRIWTDFVQFSVVTNAPLEHFVEDLDFSALDH